MGGGSLLCSLWSDGHLQITYKERANETEMFCTTMFCCIKPNIDKYLIGVLTNEVVFIMKWLIVG